MSENYNDDEIIDSIQRKRETNPKNSVFSAADLRARPVR